MTIGRTLAWVLVLAAGVSLGGAANATAEQCPLSRYCGPWPPLLPSLGASVSPQKLPVREFVPVTWSVFGKIKTRDGTHPSALREVVADVDRDLRINAAGYPGCGVRRLRRRTARAAVEACREALLGEGKAKFQIASSEGSPAIVPSRLLVFNGDERGGTARLLIHAFIAKPAPTTAIAVVTLDRKGAGIHTTSRIPAIAGGLGSLISFQFEVGATHARRGDRVGYLEARCPDSVFQLDFPRLLFENEARVPGVASTTVLKGGVAVPCAPSG
jgi:hypothetical protein